MNFADAVSKMVHDFGLVFTNSGYALFNIEAHIVCAIILIMLFNRQQSSSDQTEASIIWKRLLFVQILYFLSYILMVFVDVKIIFRTNISQYIVTALNFGLFGCLCWLIFVYVDSYQKLAVLNTLKRKIFAALPFIFNIIIIISSPLTGLFMNISGEIVKPGLLYSLIICINLAYPFTAVILAIMGRNKLNRYERVFIPIISVYPALFLAAGLLQLLNWKMPLLCYVILISDIFIYISYADSLVSIDPLTKIANRNGLMRNLSERLGQENPELLNVFVVDIEDLSSINSNFGRPEGDRALKMVANALKKFSTDEHKCFISHYYGDEFILTADIPDKETLELFIEHIKNYVSNEAMNSELKYHLRVNVGRSNYEQFNKTETISGLIEEAERSLNENKEQRRFQTLWKWKI